MTSRFPWCETLLLGLAALVLAVLLVPAWPALPPRLQPWALRLSGLWLLWRVLLWQRRLARWHAWRVSPTWTTTPARLRPAAGLCLGQGFVWTGTQVQALEWALWEDGALPLAQGPRGGYPALQAVGRTQEQPLVVSDELLKRHVGLLGTTGSGKSRALESLIAQAIGG